MKPSRNQPCPCGSGKKFKHCCDGKSAGRILDPDAALKTGIHFHQVGKLTKAGAIYKSILVEHPEHADALHLFGLVNHSTGQSELAYDFIQTAIRHNPAAAIYHSNLADVCRGLGRLDEALVVAQQACELQPDLPEAHFQLGKTLRAQRKNEAAMQALKRALMLQPTLTEASLVLAQVLCALKRKDEAISCLEAANVLQPGQFGVIKSIGNILSMMDRHEEAIHHYLTQLAAYPVYTLLMYEALAESYTVSGNSEAAADCYRKLLELRPEDEHARHFLKVVTGEHGEHGDAPPLGYVRVLFDDYAETFDNHLVKYLEYRTHVLMGEAIRDLVGTTRNDLDCLDLGCGTGLLGPEIRQLCRTLEGCDLSPKMIDQARKRKLYDRLDVDELLSFLSKRSDGSVDLITASDVFIYLSQLKDIFVQSRRTLRVGGWLAFSIELLDDTGKDYALKSSGRYAHAPSYISRLCEQTGYTVTYRREVTLRKEADVPMPGLIYVLSTR